MTQASESACSGRPGRHHGRGRRRRARRAGHGVRLTESQSVAAARGTPGRRPSPGPGRPSVTPSRTFKSRLPVRPVTIGLAGGPGPPEGRGARAGPALRLALSETLPGWQVPGQARTLSWPRQLSVGQRGT
jgi:hypothetical protein